MGSPCYICDNGRKEESRITGSKITRVNTCIAEVSKSVCKINCSIEGSSIEGSGFFIKFHLGSTDFYCIMTNEHVVKKKSIENIEIINISYNYKKENLRIELNSSLRYIKAFNKDEDKLDITIIQIIPEDNIDIGICLEPELKYQDNYNELIGKEIFVIQYPGVEDLSFSEGKIKGINEFYEFAHLASTDEGSSGSPICLINSKKVLGIHKAGKKDNTENYGDFIWPIYKFLSEDMKLKNLLKVQENITNKMAFISNIGTGYGKCLFENGDYYLGNLKEGIPQGIGTLFGKDNNKKFEGKFDKGKAVNGTYFFENGEFYKGSLKNNKYQGHGQLFDKNGNIKYDGEYNNGKKEGEGKLFYKNGEKYEGFFHINKRHGKGKLFYKNGNIKYDGDFLNDNFQGKGILYKNKGKIIYEGNFDDNVFSGKGRYNYDSGNYYVGDFKKGKKSGYGKLYAKNGDIIYEGDFARDNFEGEGTYYYEDSSYYVGDFKNGMKHGKGTMYSPNGKVKYEGKFKNDEFIKNEEYDG